MLSVYGISQLTDDVVPREVKTGDANMEQSFAPRIDLALREHIVSGYGRICIDQTYRSFGQDVQSCIEISIENYAGGY
jgi:hypothetical protein